MSWRRRLGVAAISIVALSALTAGGLFAAMSVVESPTYAWRVLVHGESDINDQSVFPERTIASASQPSVIPRGRAAVPDEVTYPYVGADRTEPLDTLIDRTGTRAFIVIQNDRVVLETYASGSSREAMNTSFSAAKSVVSTLIGAAIADGYIGSVDDRVVTYVPEIAGRGLDTLTIRDLLLMNTGIRYVTNDEQPFYMSPFGDDALTYYGSDLRRLALSVEASTTPIGQGFRYNNYHPLIEGLILERATGMRVSTYLEQRIWQPMGAEFPASWSLDSDEHGFEKMESGLNARAIDYARFGLIFLHGGLWNGQRILPEDWVREATAPIVPDPRPWEVFAGWQQMGGYYKYHWWGLVNADRSTDFMARGKYQQLIYVAPRKNAVVVRLGDNPDEAVNWPLIIRRLVDALP